MINMETRVHKLLILAGQEGVDLEARDFKKLSEVIVNEYLSEPNPSFRTFLIDIMAKVVSRIPLKSHLYAGLTVAIAKGYPDLAGKILENVVGTLHTSLTVGNFSDTLNCLNYLSETMNVSFLNSLNYMNLLEDLLLAAQQESDATLKKSLVSVLLRALPLCACSLSEKTYHEFKKFMEKLQKLSPEDELFTYLQMMFGQDRLPNYSAMQRLEIDFGGVTQHNGKLRLLLDLKNARGKEPYQKAELYKWEVKYNNLDYEAYRKGEGLIVRTWLEQLLETFPGNSQMLQLKFSNLVRTKSNSLHQVRFIVETLILRALRVRSGGMAEIWLLVQLRNNEELTKFASCVEELLFEFFNSAEAFELSLLMAFAKLFSYIANNSKQEMQWDKYADREGNFLKRAALLKLIIEKVTLLNDKFKCPEVLSSFENPKPFTSEEEYTTNSDQETFLKFSNALREKTEVSVVAELIASERDYQIFLESFFRRTSVSQTHLDILSERYSAILRKSSEWDWDLINKIRNFFKNSFFHRLLYLRFMIGNKYLSFASYVNYVGGLKNKKEAEMIWIKMELNELNNEFGKSLKSTK